MMKKSVFFLGIFVMCLSAGTAIGMAASGEKPLPPLFISIAAVPPVVNPADIRPGDVVEFKVVARSFMDADTMVIKVDLAEGVELVSGDTSWSGPVARNEEKTVNFTVRAPAKGAGKIKARVSIRGARDEAFSKQVQYEMGVEANKKTRPIPPVKKDSRGRGLIEYQ